MKRRGFTLVELLAVLVLVSALILIAIPSIINYVNESKDDISSVPKELIFSGARLYVDANPTKYTKKEGKTFCITLKDIVDGNVLSTPIIDSISGKEIDLNTFVKLEYIYDTDLKYVKPIYAITDECETPKYICSAVTGETVTEGNIPEGGYNPGDEYICEVSSGQSYHFFVLNKDSNNNVQLLMDQNLGGPIPWSVSGMISADADTAKEALADRTDNWTLIKNVNGKIEIPDAQTMATAMGDTEWREDYYSGFQGPSWINTYLDGEENFYGYWTTTPVVETDNRAWFMYYDGWLGYDDDLDNDFAYGIRPVITINTSNIKN